MNLSYESPAKERDVYRIPIIRVAFVLSIIIHAAILLPWMKPPVFLAPGEGTEKAANRFQVRLAPIAIPSTPPPVSTPSARPAPARRAPPPSAVARRPQPERAPVIALNTPGPANPPPLPSTPSTPPAPPVRSAIPNPAGDMAALIEARRQSRGDPAPPAPLRPQVAEDENRRRDRIVSENLGSQRAPTFGQEPRGGGGIFQVEHVYYDYADFTFYGWNRDIKRNTNQLIEVRKGNASDIRVAVVRKMIAIIREYEQEEFRWDSSRLGRSITLSARQRDNAGLEDFMMTEFFEDYQRRR